MARRPLHVLVIVVSIKDTHIVRQSIYPHYEIKGTYFHEHKVTAKHDNMNAHTTPASSALLCVLD